MIVSGGDPLVMKSERIEALLRELAEIESIGNVRVASRTPGHAAPAHHRRAVSRAARASLSSG